MFPIKIASANAVVLVLGAFLTDIAEPVDTCEAWDAEYVLAANLTLKETPMGEGDGTYAIGPGRVVLRYTREGDRTTVKMVSYAMREQFTIKSKTLLWTTTVTTNTKTAAIPDACGSVAEGALTDRAVRWATPVSGYHTDGTLTCEGSLCGKFGAPPAGTTELHIAPHPVQFNSFQLSEDGKTFTMGGTFVSKTEMPKQTGYVTLAGREVKRTCVPARVCK
jgi:hypothetical protein